MPTKAAAKKASRISGTHASGGVRLRQRELEKAATALDSRDSETARAILGELVASDPAPSGDLLQQYSRALRGTNEYPESSHAMERAYRAFLEEGDVLGAVRATTALVMLRGIPGDRAGAKVWETRGWRHLETLGPCVERGYHALAWVGCDVHDPHDLVQRAELALGIAREFKDPDLEVRALADKGLALISLGKVDQGFDLLDEVMVGLGGGDPRDLVMRGTTMCALMTACERTGDRGRAEVWGRAIEEDPDVLQIPISVTHCEIVYGVVESMRGKWEQAAERLQQAMDAEATSIYHRATSTARLAELRIQQGKYDEAAALLEDYQDEFEAAPAVVALSIAQGDLKRATGVLRSYTRGLGGDCLRLAPALAQLVELELRRDDVAAATRASQRLLTLEADECGSNEIRALARLASARIAEHKSDYAAAVDELETALTLLVHRDRPLLTAQIRLELARTLAGAGETDSAIVEAEAAVATFRKLGVVPEIAAGSELLQKLQAAGEAVTTMAPTRETAPLRHPSGTVENLTRRESEVALLVAEGHTNKEIAKRLFLSVRTVETHVDRVLGKLDFRTRTQLAAWVKRGEPAQGRVLSTVMFTDIVGSTEHAVLMGDRKWRSVLDEHDRTVRELVREFRGRVVKSTGDGFVATFDGPNQALRCAGSLRTALETRGIRIRTGVHTGEVELRDDDIGGVAVHTAARVMAQAGPDDIMVSSTVRDLVAGSGIEFADRGDHQLKGLPGEWRLLAVERLPEE
jgi:class 3 adenylate cyclase/tetratricopeptide (TPR) repeat protein